jgi:ABC-type multidrug transport system permease subunit
VVEYLKLNPSRNQACGEYLNPYIDLVRAGYIEKPDATSDCLFCSVSKTDTFLAAIGSHLDDAWRNFGLMWVYIAFNILGAMFIYWLVLLPKGKQPPGAI